MALTNNLNYHFTSVAYNGMGLAFRDAPTGNLKNVCIMKKNLDDRRQVWKYQVDSVGPRLHVNISNSYVLDRSSGATTSYANNAHLYAGASTSAADSVLTFENISGNIYRIKLADGRCLTAANNNNGIIAKTITTSTELASGVKNVFWATAYPSTSPSYNKQCWEATIVDAPINSNVVVTSMPDEADYPGREEDFHPESGMSNGSWSANGGGTIAYKLYTFFNKIYGHYPTGNIQYLYNLFGAKLRGTSQYHIGVDLNNGRGSEIKLPFSGTLINYPENDTNHSVGIYDGTRTYYFLHMDPLNITGARYYNQAIAKDTVLGYESDYGNATGPHLHVEVHEGKVTDGPKNTVTVTKSIPSVEPYDFF